MMTCRRITELTARESAGELGFGYKLAVGLHRGFCADCRRFARQIAEIEAVSAAFFTDAAPRAAEVQLSDETRTRMKLALKTEASGDPS